MPNIQYQIVLTSEGVSSGPYYVVTYSTGSGTYFPVIAGSPAYLPNVGSIATVAITSGSYANLSFKLNNGIGGDCELCNNDVIYVVTGSTPAPTPTPTPSPTPSPTPTPTPSPTPTPTPSPTPTPTPSPTPSYYYYAVKQNQCNLPSSCTFVADKVARSSTVKSTIDGVYYNPSGDGYTYQIQTEITPAPMSFDVDISSAPSNANCITACSI